MKVKVGDNVKVIAGKDKGKTGNVLVAMPADNSVVVAGVNMIAKHKKPRSANDKGGIIKKEGKIDASNASSVESEILAIRQNNPTNELVLDADKLEYISSAGLRILLSTQKKMQQTGAMKVINVCAEVMEVFEMTGFADILNIE